MISSRKELKEYIASDNSWYHPAGLKDRLVARIAHYPQWRLERYLVFLRKQEYYINTARGSRIKGFLGIYYEGRKNALGEKLGMEIPPNCFGKGLQIYHAGIVVNAAVQAGDNCKLHGVNCIGNNGLTKAVPRLGDDVELGYGSVIIGDVRIADHCIVGANAVVNRSFEEAGSTVVGVPARKIDRQGKKP